MPENDLQRLPVSADGVKGLAMMVPAIGLPIAFHVLNGVMIAGAGVLALSAALTPFSGEIMKVLGKLSATDRHGVEESPPDPEIAQDATR
jgi:hypothetical protein